MERFSTKLENWYINTDIVEFIGIRIALQIAKLVMRVVAIIGSILFLVYLLIHHVASAISTIVGK